MTDPRHDRLRALFDAALGLPAADRAAFVAGACPDDASLQARVLALLAAADDDRFLAAPERTPTAVGEQPGDHIGPFTLARRLGEGGFGVVFEAVQRQPVARTVALKVLKPGMDSARVLARFELERQALARMDHPHIARVLDGGATASGRPYFAMELVQGEPIGAFCDRHQLPIDARLALFEQVCLAVQHAHQKGVLHRDLKPSNVLVATPDGRPHAKVIDFGIAKAIEPDAGESALTLSREVLGTLRYMSPEQAAGAGDVDTRSDVWGLGVLLYELLTGSPPFDAHTLDAAALAEAQRVIREVDPPKPSTRVVTRDDTIAGIAALRGTEPRRLGLRLRGDLDWIVMKALAKEPERRYASAGAFAADLRAHLAGDPVTAAPPSRAYRLRKLVRKHRGTVASVAAVALSLLAGAAAFAWQASVARAERDTARIETARAGRMFDFVADTLSAADPNLGGRRELRVDEAMHRALARLDQGALAADPGVESGLRSTIAWILANAGGGDAALRSGEKALQLARAVHTGDHRDVVRCLGSLATAQCALGHFADAATRLDEAIAMSRRLAPGDHPDTALLLSTQARVLHERGDLAGAAAVATDALAMLRRLHPGDDADVAATLCALADTRSILGERDAALACATEALAMLRRLFPDGHPDLARGLAVMASVRMDRGDLDGAAALYEEAVSLQRRLFPSGGDEVATALHNLGTSEWNRGHADVARAHFTEALVNYRRAHQGDHLDTARTLKDLGSAQRVLDDLAGAETSLAAARAMLERLGAATTPAMADCLAALAMVRRAQDRTGEAEQLTAGALALRRSQFAGDHVLLASAILTLAQLRAGRGAKAEAEPLFAEAAAMFARLSPAGGADAAFAALSHAGILLALNRHHDALAPTRTALAMLEHLHPDGDAMIARAETYIAVALQADGDVTGARAAFDRAIALDARFAPNGSKDRARTLWRSGQARVDNGEPAAALPELEAALAMAKRLLPPSNPDIAQYERAVTECRAALR